MFAFDTGIRPQQCDIFFGTAEAAGTPPQGIIPWRKPEKASVIGFFGISAGGGGGAGYGGPLATNRGAGAGGGPGSALIFMMPAVLVPQNLGLWIPLGGRGAIGAAGFGGAGANGSNTKIYSMDNATLLQQMGNGGSGGGQGSNAGGATGGAPGATQAFSNWTTNAVWKIATSGGTGGLGSVNANGGSPSQTQTHYAQPGGGGAATDSGNGPNNSGVSVGNDVAGIPSGGIILSLLGQDGQSGRSQILPVLASSSGGGGGSASPGPGARGGNAGFGSGGGGGGGGTTTGGSGGDGGQGLIAIWWW